MGHPVCTPNSLESDIGFLLYSGTAETLLWNEVVIGLAHQLKDIVQGVFYLDDKEDDGDTLTQQRRALAYQEAKMLGNKPVFKFETGDGLDQDLLKCDDDPREIMELSGREKSASRKRTPLIYYQNGETSKFRR